MKVFQIYDRETDAYTAWAAEDMEGAIAQYISENPPDLMVSLVWENGYVPVEGDDVQRFPMRDWRMEVVNGDTTLGYAEWLAARLSIDLEGV